MVITREMLLERLAKLEAEATQMRANLNAYEGAIQDVRHWLEVVGPDELPGPTLADADWKEHNA